MTQFLGTHQNRLDAKGRVSIPATFRTALKGLLGENALHAVAPALVLRPSHTQACIEGWPEPAFRAATASLHQLDPFGADHDDLALALFADAHPVDIDKEGRIVLPEALAAHAAITEGVAFIGRGNIFQMWEPGAVAQRMAEARVRARGVKLTAGTP